MSTQAPEAPPHPAKFSREILDTCQQFLPAHKYSLVLDPFAGVGGVHALEQETVGIEIEPEWADQDEATIRGDATDLPFLDGTFDAICTSPCYGNRMADHHEAKDDSRRVTYRHYLGRPLSENSAGKLQWGAEYRLFHEAAWAEALRVLRPGGRFVLNIKDHVRKGELVSVSGWHTATLVNLGLDLLDVQEVRVPGMRFGQNHGARVDYEYVVAFDKPEVS